MKGYRSLLHMLLIATVLTVTCLLLFANQPGARVLAAPVVNLDDELPQGGFVADGPRVNPATTQGATPALVVQPQGDIWSAFSQDHQIVVTKFDRTSQTWRQQGSALGTAGSNPALAVGAAATETAWIAWTETTTAAKQIMTAYFVGNTWQSGGALNPGAAAAGDHAALALGAAVTAATPLPWVAWDETNQIRVKRAISDSAAGSEWSAVGDPAALVPAALASKPALAFSGSGNATPWLAWPAQAGASHLILAARAIADTAAPGGFHWQPVGRVAACDQAACNLQADAQQPAGDVALASGALLGEASPAPWIAFATGDPGQIQVLHLDNGATLADLTDDRFIPAGVAVNTQCLTDAGLTTGAGSQPAIYFVGNAPHVAWIETRNGVGQLFVCHLADARPGQERWDLDTLFPINHASPATAAAPALSSDGNTPYVAWQEGAAQSSIFVAHRYPAGPAWGRNYPPFIRTISWSRNFVGRAWPDEGIGRAIEAMSASTKPLTLTTSCNHAAGWEHIKEIHFKVANDQMIAFYGKYVAAEDKVYVEDPDHPGVFLGGVQPGSAQSPIDTANATLYVDAMRVRAHGSSSPALDIDWIISFKEPTMFQDLAQAINILYDDGQSTGFFATGALSFDYRLYLPTVNQ